MYVLFSSFSGNLLTAIICHGVKCVRRKRDIEKSATMFQYYVKIVPTTYVRKDGAVWQTNQFSVTRHQKVVAVSSGDYGMPGIFFNYELAPMMVKYTEREKSFGHCATNICAIIGGIFTVAGIVDSLLYHSVRVIQKKIELGKVN